MKFQPSHQNTCVNRCECVLGLGGDLHSFTWVVHAEILWCWYKFMHYQIICYFRVIYDVWSHITVVEVHVNVGVSLVGCKDAFIDWVCINHCLFHVIRQHHINVSIIPVPASHECQHHMIASIMTLSSPSCSHWMWNANWIDMYKNPLKRWNG